MKPSVKQTQWTRSGGLLALVSGLFLSSGAFAGTSAGTIVFVSEGPVSEASALSVPTLGAMAAVMLAAVLLLVALRVLQKNRHTFASWAFVGVAVTAAMSVASMGLVQAVDNNVDVNASDLGQPLTFSCGGAGPLNTSFTNRTQGVIAVDSVMITDTACGLYGGTTCLPAGEGEATRLAPGDICVVQAGPD